jgi:acyl carrier protein
MRQCDPQARRFRPSTLGRKRLEPAKLAPTTDRKRYSLTTTFEKVADLIAETTEIDRDKITPESHTIDDLGIDSLDFLDTVFAIDKEFGIKIPLEKWTQDVNEGRVSTEEYFVLKNLCAKIDALVAAKKAA